MALPPPDNPDQFRRLAEIMEALLSPEGCPWDREQSHKSLRPYVVEEAYEVVDAIDGDDDAELCAELGDLGLQIVFHAALARRRGAFALDDVYRSICEKLIRRHPHVFGDTDAKDATTVLRNWEAIKREERAAKGAAEKAPSALDGVPRSLPALQRAARIQDKARRVNFDWPDVTGTLDKVREEIDELRTELDTKAPLDETQRERIAAEFGDLLFALVNVARFLAIDPENALQTTTAKFIRRFHHIETRLAESGRTPRESTLEEMDEFWNEAKRLERG